MNWSVPCAKPFGKALSTWAIGLGPALGRVRATFLEGKGYEKEGYSSLTPSLLILPSREFAYVYLQFFLDFLLVHPATSALHGVPAPCFSSGDPSRARWGQVPGALPQRVTSERRSAGSGRSFGPKRRDAATSRRFGLRWMCCC